MMQSRKNRLEEEKTLKRFLILTGISIVSIILILLVGIPLIVSGSAFLADKKNGNTPVNSNTDTTAPLAPTVDHIISATNSAKMKITGFGEPESEISLFLNDNKQDTLKAETDGQFSFKNIILRDGMNSIYVTAKDAAGNESEPSETQTVSFSKEAPRLEISEPTEGQNFSGKNQEITIKGITNKESHVTINDRFVRIEDDGSFTFTLKLSDGENTLNIVSVDAAGNQSKMERKVTYSP